jgi:hypothetical protein
MLSNGSIDIIKRIIYINVPGHRKVRVNRLIPLSSSLPALRAANAHIRTHRNELKEKYRVKLDGLYKNVNFGGTGKWFIEDIEEFAKSHKLNLRRIDATIKRGRESYINYVLKQMMGAFPARAWKWSQIDDPRVQSLAKKYWEKKYPELINGIDNDDDMELAEAVAKMYSFEIEKARAKYYRDTFEFHLKEAKTGHDVEDHIDVATVLSEEYGFNMDRVLAAEKIGLREYFNILLKEVADGADPIHATELAKEQGYSMKRLEDARKKGLRKKCLECMKAEDEKFEICYVAGVALSKELGLPTKQLDEAMENYTLNIDTGFFPSFFPCPSACAWSESGPSSASEGQFKMSGAHAESFPSGYDASGFATSHEYVINDLNPNAGFKTEAKTWP